MQTLSAAVVGSDRPRTGARLFRLCHTCSVTNGMIGWSSRLSPSKQRSQNALGDGTGSRIAQPAFDKLEVPIAEMPPCEIAQLAGRLGKLELFQGRGHQGDRSIEPIDDPAILDRQVVRAIGAGS